MTGRSFAPTGRSLAVIGGLGAIAGGVALLGVPSLTLDGPAGTVVLVAGGLAAIAASGGALRTIRAPPADPRFAAKSPGHRVPGDDVDALLDSLRVSDHATVDAARSPTGEGGRSAAGNDTRAESEEGPGSDRSERPREQLQERLAAVAAEVIADAEGCSRTDAQAYLDAGEWTDDPVAAAFFQGNPPSTSRFGQLRALATGDPPARRRARRAIEQLDELDGGNS